MQDASSFRAAPFDCVAIDELERLSPDEFDQLPFGDVGMGPSGEVEVFNAYESRMSGLRSERVLGGPFFSEIGRCMNNDRVARRFDKEPELDAAINYTLTLRLRITPAKLRLLGSASARRRYLLVQR